MLMAFAEFERDMIAERTREKLYTQARSGYWGGGHVPLGYDVVDKKLIQNPKEAEIVRRTFSQNLATPSTVKVAKWLNDQGVKTKTRATKAGKTSGGGEFSNQLVHDMLRNKIYIGQVKFKDESFKGLHEPIVDDILFEKIAKRLDESIVDRFGTYEDTPLLLLGLTKCGICGGQMTTFFSQKKDTGQRHFYYRCTTATKFGRHKCESRTLPAFELEDFTSRLMIHTASDEEFFEAILKQLKGNAHVSLEEKRKLRSELALNQSSMKKQLNNLATNLTLMELKSDEVVEYKAKSDSLKMQATALDTRLRALDQDVNALETQQINKTELHSVFQDFGAVYANAPQDVKRKLLKVIIEEIRCTVKRGQKTGEITFKLRGDGSVKKNWNEAKETKEDSSTPSSGGLSPHVAWLPVNRRFTNSTTITLPIVAKTRKFGEQRMAVDFSRLADFLPLPEIAVNRLRAVFEILDKDRIKKNKERLNLPLLAQQYQELLTNGTCNNLSDIARHFGVSRVWIHKVMKHLPGPATQS